MKDEPITPDDIIEMLSKEKSIKGKKIRLTSQKTVNKPELKPYVDKILKAIGVKTAWISDKSSFGDFAFLEEEDLGRMSEELGVYVEWESLLGETAERMQENESR